MTCESRRDIDIAAYLVEPKAPEWAEFRLHYPGCRECSAELSRWTALEGALRRVTEPAHPTDELLLAFRRAPESLSQAQRDEMSAHLEGCGPCRDAVGAVVGLDLKQLLAAAKPAAQPQRAGLLQGVLDSLRGLFELPAPVLAAGAVALLILVLGVPFLLQQGGDLSEPPAPPIAQHEQPPAPAASDPAPVLEPKPAELIAVEELPTPPAEDLQPPAPEQVVVEAPAPQPEPVPEQPAPPVEVAQQPPAPAPTPEPAPFEHTPAPAPAPKAASWVVASLGPEPLVYAAPAGLPGGRIGGRARSGPEGPAPLALVPNQIGQTLESRPTLYWFLSARSEKPVQLRVNDIDSMKQVLSKTLRAPLAAGFHALRLADHGVKLATGRNYEWIVSLPESDTGGSGGILRRVSNPALTTSLSQADPAGRLRLLAEQGIWYDAFDLLSRSIARRPNDADLRRGRAELLDQVGLGEAAAWDRRR